MKKIFLLLATFGLLTLSGCNNDDDRIIDNGYVDNDTYSEVVDLNNVNLGFDASTGRYSIVFPLDPPIFSSDVILAYRWINDDGFWVWDPIPATLYLSDGNEVDYRFNFNEESVLIYADATFNLASAPEFTQNQSFRIVIVPGYFAETMQTNDYDSVMSSLRQSQIEVKQRTMIKK